MKESKSTSARCVELVDAEIDSVSGGDNIGVPVQQRPPVQSGGYGEHLRPL